VCFYGINEKKRNVILLPKVLLAFSWLKLLCVCSDCALYLINSLYQSSTHSWVSFYIEIVNSQK